jgi:hypothetical protein
MACVSERASLSPGSRGQIKAMLRRRLLVPGWAAITAATPAKFIEQFPFWQGSRPVFCMAHIRSRELPDDQFPREAKARIAGVEHRVA